MRARFPPDTAGGARESGADIAPQRGLCARCHFNFSLLPRAAVSRFQAHPNPLPPSTCAQLQGMAFDLTPFFDNGTPFAAGAQGLVFSTPIHPPVTVPRESLLATASLQFY